MAYMSLVMNQIILGITGGIAAYKAAELTRLLVKDGLGVEVVMTQSACEFITPTTLQGLSGRKVHHKLWNDDSNNALAHIDLSRQAKAILIAPASANFIAKLTHGLADDLLSTLCLARNCPLIIAPAMNKQMWEHPATVRNIAQLQNDGVIVFGPAVGEQACGEYGLGRMLEPIEIQTKLKTWMETSTKKKQLDGLNLLITAGPTLEHIDPVRVITNLSSGKMGYSIADTAVQMGANVTLISGPTHLRTPSQVRMVPIVSAKEMHQAVMKEVTNADVFISVAAVADFKPAQPSAHKLKKSNPLSHLELEPTEDILASVAKLPNPPFCVGFAAESEDLTNHAEQKRLRKGIPMIAANIATETLGLDEISLLILDQQGSHPLPRMSKADAAIALLTHMAKRLPPSTHRKS
jgi:phosphopantothenoylcysteine decarboxylase / phosphopantothenate---cysteine ligase